MECDDSYRFVFCSRRVSEVMAYLRESELRNDVQFVIVLDSLLHVVCYQKDL